MYVVDASGGAPTIGDTMVPGVTGERLVGGAVYAVGRLRWGLASAEENVGRPSAEMTDVRGAEPMLMDGWARSRGCDLRGR